jgi:Protein of unknown function (DUF2934)
MDKTTPDGLAGTPALTFDPERRTAMNPDQEELVRERAYLLWEDEGRPEGCADRHWMTAERSLADEDMAWQSPANGEVEPTEGAGLYQRPDEDAAETLQPLGRARRSA